MLRPRTPQGNPPRKTPAGRTSIASAKCRGCWPPPHNCRLPNSLRPHTYRTLLGLLYSTGIRIGEAFALNLEDFHREEQNLYIAAGKFRKARWVSLSGTANDALRQYVEKRQRISPWRA